MDQSQYPWKHLIDIIKAKKHVAMRYSRDNQQAECLMFQVVEKLYTGVIKGTIDLNKIIDDGFVYTSLRNHCIDHIRKSKPLEDKKKQYILNKDSFYEEDVFSHKSSHKHRLNIDSELFEFFNSLEKRIVDILLFKHVGNKTYKEIQHILKIMTTADSIRKKVKYVEGKAKRIVFKNQIRRNKIENTIHMFFQPYLDIKTYKNE